ncbi:hypothetical protein HX004_07845 [Myroides sp. 1354]|uniref:hypothetical protein n=1 Tax=unclassified Myroides TaxID=2642485 RepID=UPI0025787D47|nr:MULTISPECIES: hypothetical protein [unclassified Myroides]MDM1044973.1 hypothetical protein [Myroides sp. R163-1]MDM1055686.1 hypothetical protein [Myroides sp. 1354]MDM1068983.1 hypothetical protein [Myroides sp. 1372]
MVEVFIKKYWDEENVMFFIHFQEGKAMRQVEINPTSKLLLTAECPMKGDSMLYDQSLDELELQESDFITQEEFELIWEEK